MNITYLLGAGASINSVPAVKGMNEHLEKFNNLVKALPESDFDDLEPFRKFKRSLEDIVQNLQKFSTIDKYAKHVNTFSGDKGLNDLKITFSIYLVLIQILDKKATGLSWIGNDGKEHFYDRIDKRYFDFLTDILVRQESRNYIPNNIKILTWNYDIQFELAFFKYNKYLQSLDEVMTEIPVYPKFQRSRRANENNETPAIIHLNGLAGLNHTFRSPHDFKSPIDVYSFYDRIEESDTLIEALNKLLWLYTESGRSKTGVLETMTFAFERSRETFNVSKQFAIKIAQKTDRLVIIGYSVPDYNFEYDKDFFEALNKEAKIVIQNPEDVRNNLIDYYGIDSSRMILRNKPHELYNFIIPRN